MARIYYKTRKYLAENSQEMIEQYKESLQKYNYCYPRATAKLQQQHPSINITPHVLNTFLEKANLTPNHFYRQISTLKLHDYYIKDEHDEVLKFMETVLSPAIFGKGISIPELWSVYNQWAADIHELPLPFTYADFRRQVLSIVTKHEFKCKVGTVDGRYGLVDVLLKQEYLHYLIPARLKE